MLGPRGAVASRAVAPGAAARLRAAGWSRGEGGEFACNSIPIGNNLLNTDPASLTDARVVEVKIRLDDSAKASRLIHGKVTVVIGN